MMPAFAAYSFTICQITFSVMPSPQVDPLLVTQRNSRPSVIGAALVQMSIADFTQFRVECTPS